MARDEEEELSLIVRRKKIPPEPGHVAAWKIAYADFVTAMMAFFLLLWLLNASMTVDMALVGNSFTPDEEVAEVSATGNKFDAGGASNEDIEGRVENQQVVSTIFTLDTRVEETVLENKPQEDRLTTKKEQMQGDTKVNDGELVLDDVENQLLQALRKIYTENPAESVTARIFTDKAGLNIEFINSEGQRTFRRNSAEMTRPLRNTLFVSTRFLARLKRHIMITGHSALEGDFENQWQLSMKRADITRQHMIRMGIPEGRIFGIGGKGASQPIDFSDRDSMQNIRVQITLLSDEDHQVQAQDIRFSAPPRISE